MSNTRTNWHSVGGLVALVLAVAVTSSVATYLAMVVRVNAEARNIADDIIEARTRTRTIEVRQLKLNSRQPWWQASATKASEVRDTLTGRSWIVLQVGGIALVLDAQDRPTLPGSITEISPEPR